MVHQNLSRLADWFLSRSRTVKRMITLAVDLCAVIFSLWLAFSLRYGVLYQPPQAQLWIFFLAPAIAIPIFIKMGLYRAIIRYLSLHALWTVIKATLLYALIFAVIVLLAGVEQVPRTVYGINALILILFVAGTRYIARWWFASSVGVERFHAVTKRHIPPVIIYGAGASGAQLVAALKLSRQLKPVAFIDDDPGLVQQQVMGLTVYPFSQLISLIDKYDVHDLLLAMPSVSRQVRHRILQLLEPYPVHVRSLPGLMDLAQGKVTVSDIQEVDIADLLGRDAVASDPQLLHANITDKVVMVTGAGGSIGSELCRQIVQLAPRVVVLYELSEFALYQIEKELLALDKGVPIYALLGDVRDQPRLTSVCRHFSVQTIYHAAAYKHVPMVERNMIAGIRNNVFGTLACVNAAIDSKVETFVLISTDKAVRPTNTMGASKRLAELILQAKAQKPAQFSTRFTMVRFGNVLGSSGSVVPLFREQIQKGGPITVTDPRIIRYFMSIPEAAELVIQAGAMGHGGDVFVLDMGEPVRIVDLAKRMIHLSGFTEKDTDNPDGDIEIIFTGLRPGEKLYEELLIGDDVSETPHQKILRAREKVIPWEELENRLQQLQQACATNDLQRVRKILLACVDEFKPQCGIEDNLFIPKV